MQNTRGQILWIDDEIHHLKPHILFLEDKGYILSQAANGQDGIALSEQNNYDLIRLANMIDNSINTIVNLFQK